MYKKIFFGILCSILFIPISHAETKTSLTLMVPISFDNLVKPQNGGKRKLFCSTFISKPSLSINSDGTRSKKFLSGMIAYVKQPITLFPDEGHIDHIYQVEINQVSSGYDIRDSKYYRCHVYISGKDGNVLAFINATESQAIAAKGTKTVLGTFGRSIIPKPDTKFNLVTSGKINWDKPSNKTNDKLHPQLPAGGNNLQPRLPVGR